MGHMTSDRQEFQDVVDAASDSLIVVDFFMPNCTYCVKFMPEWNRLVEDLGTEYGERIKFLKVDGTSDRYTASRYDVHSFPTFIILEPGTHGETFTTFSSNTQRNYANMKRWILGFA